MDISINAYKEKVYAGVLGKIIGVYYGRPVEGWPYEKIKKEIGIVDKYMNDLVHRPLIIADDDLSGTFTFLNNVEDIGVLENLSSYSFGQMWLNYIIEDKTIFWWGGKGRSTEHTAFLNLKQGVPAPMSGSMSLNGKAISEQIGAQIFIDALAMLFPGRPDLAVRIVENSAKVSHDGIAVEAAKFIAAVEAQAFIEDDIDQLYSCGKNFVSKELASIVDDAVSFAKDFRIDEWRELREIINQEYGYHLYPGNCHVVPNFVLIIAMLYLSKDDFRKAIELIVSSGWDTDCNAGTLGCINGIRLGLEGIDRSAYNLRGPIADRFYKVSGLGGECVSDAVSEMKRIVNAHSRLFHKNNYLNRYKYSFEMRGAVQGFSSCPILGKKKEEIINGNTIGLDSGLIIKSGESISMPTMWDPDDVHSSYQLIGSPTLYEGQIVRVKLEAIGEEESRFKLYIVYYDENDHCKITYSQSFTTSQDKIVKWKIPVKRSFTIARLGVSNNSENSILLKEIDWNGAPALLHYKGSLKNIGLQRETMKFKAFTSSARNASSDLINTFVVSHPQGEGIFVIGDRRWDNYSLKATIIPSLHNRFSIICRTRGLRKYYAVSFSKMNSARMILKDGNAEDILCEKEFLYQLDNPIQVELNVKGNTISAWINDVLFAEVIDDKYVSGAAGFSVEDGTILVNDFMIKSLNKS